MRKTLYLAENLSKNRFSVFSLRNNQRQLLVRNLSSEDAKHLADDLKALEDTPLAEARNHRVIRVDTNGVRHQVPGTYTKQEAEAKVEKFESGYPHHNGYFVEEEPSANIGKKF